MHEAMFYKKMPDGRVKCSLCPHNCTIPEGKTGFCGVRANTGGILESLVYGKVSSMAVDPIEKKPLFHFNPSSLVMSFGTLGCTMHCGHCQNWEISHVILAESFDKNKVYEISQPRATEFISPEKAVDLALANDCDGIAWTYNEPTVWFEYTLDTAKLAKASGLYTVYVTNGYINQEPLEMIAPYLDAFRVDIKGFNNEFYRKVAKIPDFKPILDATIIAKKNLNMHVEIVTNIIPGENDDEEQLRGIARWIKTHLGAETPWHVTRFHPHLEFSETQATPVETLEAAHDIGIEEGLQFVYLGNVPGHEYESTYCPKCSNLIIERQGYEVVNFDIDDDNKCNFCSQLIDIKWNR